MTAPRDKQAQRLSALFNAEAEKALDGHKCLRNGLMIIDPAHATTAFAIRANAQDKRSAEDHQKNIAWLSRFFAKTDHSACNISQGYNIIVMAPHVTQRQDMFGLPGLKETIFVLDHEIGHLVVDGGFFGMRPNPKENCADAFALLRACQRFGTLAPFLRANRFKRAFDAVFKGRMSHYTLPMSAALANLSPAAIKALDPEKTAELAGKIARDNTLPPLELANLGYAFKPVCGLYDGNDDNIERAALQLAVLLQNPALDRMAFATGKLVLDELLAGQLPVHGKKIELRDPRWPQIKQTLDRLAGIAPKAAAPARKK